MAETIDKLFLELSQVTEAKTERELHLERKLEGLEKTRALLHKIHKALSGAEFHLSTDGSLSLMVSAFNAEALQKSYQDATHLLKSI